MKIKSIRIEVHRSQGRPLVYAINPLTVGPSQFALIAGVTAGAIESDRINAANAMAGTCSLKRAIRREHRS